MIQYIKHWIYLFICHLYEINRYLKFSEGKRFAEKRFDYQLTVAAHTIEKGLGNISYKNHWGYDKAVRLCSLLNEYLECGYDTKQYGFSESISILLSYIRHKKECGEGNFIQGIEHELKSICEKSDIKKYPSGKEIVSLSDLKIQDETAAEELLKKCRSIRNYSNIEPQEELITSAVKLATKAPSACNRQPVRCYYTMNKEKIAKVDSLVPGNKTIAGKTPNWIVVTSSLTFFSIYEYDQWYVNGGIFLGYLRLALHLKGIGNCIYQWTNNAKDIEIRNIYNIPVNEKIIAIVGIGLLPEEAHCISAARKSVDDYLKCIK